MSELSERDMEAVATAVRILREAGYQIEKSKSAKSTDNGVAFKLECVAGTKSTRFPNQSEAVKTAAIEAPEFDYGGNLVEEVSDDV